MALPEKRWIQRLDNYEKALAILERVFLIGRERELTEAEQMGLIQSFEFSFELAWKLMKDFLASRGVAEIFGSKDAIRQAFSAGLIENGQVWMDMIDSRNETSHAYDEKIAHRVVSRVSVSYLDEFKEFLVSMRKLRDAKQE